MVYRKVVSSGLPPRDGWHILRFKADAQKGRSCETCGRIKGQIIEALQVPSMSVYMAGVSGIKVWLTLLSV